jgi:hypothetical protein
MTQASASISCCIGHHGSETPAFTNDPLHALVQSADSSAGSDGARDHLAGKGSRIAGFMVLAVIERADQPLSERAPASRLARNHCIGVRGARLRPRPRSTDCRSANERDSGRLARKYSCMEPGAGLLVVQLVVRFAPIAAVTSSE